MTTIDVFIEKNFEEQLEKNCFDYGDGCYYPQPKYYEAFIPTKIIRSLCGFKPEEYTCKTYSCNHCKYIPEF